MTRYEEDKRFNQQTGLCITCGHQMAEPGKLKCFECAEKDRLRIAKNRNRQRESETSKARYESRKAAGLCVYCGKRKQEHGLRCNQCYIKSRKYNQPKDIRRSERVAYGLCYICGRSKMEDKKVCEICYQKRLSSIRKICYMPVSDYWKGENDLLFAKKG